MESTLSLISLPTFTSVSGSRSCSSLLCPPQSINHRGLLSLSPVNSKRFNNNGILAGKTLCFCPKASLRGNVETIGVPISVPVRVAHELLLAGHRYLDVRTPEEFNAGHASGAINIPYFYRVGSGMTKNLYFLKEVSSHFGKFDEIIIGCQSGKRSIMAATDLLAAGFTSITDIDGGFAGWRQNGLPTEP